VLNLLGIEGQVAQAYVGLDEGDEVVFAEDVYE
jgi:hypothetical protein